MTGSDRCGDVFGVILGTGLRDELELLLTNVGASENEVWDLGSRSGAECTCGGNVIGEGVALALSV